MDQEARTRTIRTRSVDNLQRLYTVVISLAITESLRRLLSEFGDKGTSPSFTAIAAVIALVVTVVPFYHGANRYLDATYVTDERSAKPATLAALMLLLDFAVIFVEAIIFFILALLINQSAFFIALLGSLFLLDAIWVGVTKWTSKSLTDQGSAYRIWLVANLVAGAIALFISLSDVWGLNVLQNQHERLWFMALVAFIRTVFDYATVWKFYYPPPQGTNYIMPLPRPAPPPQPRPTPQS
jgi:hypothetical protein